MTPYNAALQALGVPGGLTFEADGTYQILWTSGYVPAAADDFEDDITAQVGASILLRTTLSSVTWTARVFDAADASVADPGSGTATYIVLVKTANGAAVGSAGGGGTAATNRLIAYEDIADLTFDGTADTLTFNASGIFRIGA